MVRSRSVRNSKAKVAGVKLAKHISTQTTEADSSPSCGRKIHSINHTRKKWISKDSSTTRLMQTLIVKPRFESTPARVTERNGDSDTDCEMLIENVTPIRLTHSSSKRHDDRSSSLGAISNQMSKSYSNVYAPVSSPTSKSLANQYLVGDDTILKSLDWTCWEKDLEVDKEVSLPLDPAVPNDIPNDQSQNISPDTGVFPELSKENSSVSNISNETRSKCTSKNEKIFRKPGPLPVITQKPNVPKVDKTTISVTADVHWEEFPSLDVNNLGDISFMAAKCNDIHSNCEVTDYEMNPKNGTMKRQMQFDNGKSLVTIKKSKRASDVTVNGRNKGSMEPEKIGKENSQKTSKSSQNSIGSESNKDKTDKECDRSIKGDSNLTNYTSSKCDDHLQNKTLSKWSSSDVGKTSRLSVGEKIQRMLVTNAQKPVTSKLKCSDVILQDAADTTTVESFTDLGPFFGLPLEVMELFEKYKGINKLYEWQEECLRLKAVHQRKNLVYALPTSGGKTLVAEILILRELLCRHKNAVFVLPYVSIVQEKVHSLSQFAIELGFLVEEYAAGKGQYPPKKRRHRQSIYVATIEKAHSLMNSLVENKRLSEIGLVIVDELHLLGEGDRGATLECLLSKLIFVPEKIHIVGMSATIGNLEEIAKFLHAEIYVNSFRPVELKEYVKCEDTLWALNNREEELLTRVRKIDPPYTPSMRKADPDKLCSLVLEVIPEHSCLVFCASKRNCENVASLFTKLMPRELLEVKQEERKALARALLTEGKGSVCSILEKCIQFGVAYHHSGLTSDERRLLEEAYRVGTLCCICCTSTLAAGVNLPAKRVILRAPFVGCKFISISQYKQMVGRAGRAGFDVSGESILLCQQRDMERVRTLLSSKMDNALSQLHTSESRGLQSLVLSSIGLGLANSRKDLHKIATCTLLHVQSTEWDVKSKQLVDKTIRNLFKLGALKADTTTSSTRSCSNVSQVNEQSDMSLNITRPPESNANSTNRNKSKVKNIRINNNTVLKVSKVGRAAMKGPIDLCHSNELYNDIIQAQTSLVLLSCLHLLYLVTPYDMMDQIKPDPVIYFRVYNEMNVNDRQTAHVLGVNEACMLKIMKGSKACNVSEKIVHRFYVTLILNELWNQESVWEVSRKFKVPRGTVQTLMTSASTFASCVMHFCEELPEFWAIKDLLHTFVQRLSHCCSVELLQLMELPAVKTGRAKQLYNAGYKTLKDVANANAATLVSSVDHLPRKVANQIISAAKLLLLAKAENLREEAEDVLEGLFGSNFQK